MWTDDLYMWCGGKSNRLQRTIVSTWSTRLLSTIIEIEFKSSISPGGVRARTRARTWARLNARSNVRGEGA